MNISQIRQWLHEPNVRNVHVDDDELLSIHRNILCKKILLRSAFGTFYKDMSGACDKYFDGPGVEVELGSGAGFFKKIRPSVITSDIRKDHHIDAEINALEMPFEDNSVRCIYAINVFHHLPNPDLFFNELNRVLSPGGGFILIEPHGGLASAWLHRRLHNDEHFDATSPGWCNEDIGGPLSGANQALADIVFRRDLKRFEALYGNVFEIVYRGYELNALRYLLSGGLNFRQLVPNYMDKPLSFLEKLGSPIAKMWSLHQIIAIRKR